MKGRKASKLHNSVNKQGSKKEKVRKYLLIITLSIISSLIKRQTG
jgi:hypothetical protein